MTLNLKLDADADRAVSDVLSKVNQVAGILPREANDPIVTRTTGEGFALMYIGFNSDVMSSSQISDYLNRVIQPKLQSISGVANAEILGGQTFAMRIWLDPDRMAAFGVTPLDVSAALLVKILGRMYADPAHRDPFLASLPIAGKDGTVSTRLRRTRAEGNVMAKTGSISNVRSLSGYLRSRDGEMLAFSILANDFVIPPATVNWITDLAVEVLSNFTRRPGAR